MKKIRFFVLLITVLMAMTMLFTSCDETAPSTQDNGTSPSETTQCEHNYTSKVTTEATCSKDGVKTFTCSVCNDSYTESIAAGHKWTNATCKAPKTCYICKLTEGDALGHTTDNGTCRRCNTVISNKWPFSEATDLNTYANKATTNAQKAHRYAVNAMTASSTYKVLYNQYAVSYAGSAKGYLESMKAIADSNAELTLTETNGKYSTLQEKIDYAYELCDEIVNLQITSSNYATYEDKILDITSELSMECLGIHVLIVELIGTFVS